jgi:catalase
MYNYNIIPNNYHMLFIRQIREIADFIKSATPSSNSRIWQLQEYNTVDCMKGMKKI